MKRQRMNTPRFILKEDAAGVVAEQLELFSPSNKSVTAQ
jgi:hypothetical protein